jgi:uncharacterized protein (TIGR00369 family)
MTPFEKIKSEFGSAVPFARHTGIEILDVGPGLGIAQLKDQARVRNHIGSVHAGAIVTLGETASGVAMLGAFAEWLSSIRPVTSELNVAYLKIARGSLTATACTDVPAQELRRCLVNEGRSIFNVLVDIANERGIVVARLTAKWNVSLPTRSTEKLSNEL